MGSVSMTVWYEHLVLGSDFVLHVEGGVLPFHQTEVSRKFKMPFGVECLIFNTLVFSI